MTAGFWRQLLQPQLAPKKEETSGYGRQMFSGLLEGATSALGAPVDLMNNLVVSPATKGVNVLFGTNIQPSSQPLGGSAGLRQGLAIDAPSDELGKQLARRVMQSVGGAVVPAAISAQTAQQALAMLGAGVGGGIGGATAQQLFPDNLWAEIGGELLGGTGSIAAFSRGQKALNEAGKTAKIPEGQQDIAASYQHSIFPPPNHLPQRDFYKDYKRVKTAEQRSEIADAAGNLLVDMDGHKLTAPYIAGRRRLGGADEALTPEELDAIAEAAFGRRPEIVAPSALPRRAIGKYDPKTGQIGILQDLSKADKDMVLAHEVGHGLDYLAGTYNGKNLPRGIVFSEKAQAEQRKIYNDMNNPDLAAAREKAPLVAPKDVRFGRGVTPQETFGYTDKQAFQEYNAEAFRAALTNPNYIKTVAPKTAAEIRKFIKEHPILRKIVQFNSIAAAGGAGAAAMMPDDAKAAPMFDLLTNFMDRPVTQNRLLAPFLTGQEQQFSPRPNPNMLLQGAEAAQQPAPPLSAPTEVLRKQVAEVPRAVDPMPTNSTSQAMPSQPPQSKSGGFFDGLSKFGESDFGQRLGDMMLGWGMGGTQKAAFRQRALEAIKAVMPLQAILQAETALKNTDTAYPLAGTAKISSQAEFDALPSGAQFIAPDGGIRRKP